jgi:hypothetical protein
MKERSLCESDGVKSDFGFSILDFGLAGQSIQARLNQTLGARDAQKLIEPAPDAPPGQSKIQDPKSKID